jgi:hypothetical protein
MDHLPIPTDGLAWCPPEVDYVCHGRHMFDFGDFSTYPERTGIDIEQILTATAEVDWDGLAPFFQAWLWFGLINEAICLFSPREERGREQLLDQFITIHPNKRKVLNTCALPRVLSASKTAISQDSAHEIAYALRKARCVITKISSTASWQSYLSAITNAGPLPIASRVMLSIQILEETISYALEDRIAGLTPKNSQSYISPLSMSLLHILLRRAGWCPYRFRDLPCSVRVLYYLTFFTPTEYQEHYECSQEACSALHPEQPLSNFRPVHSSTQCRCGFEETSEDLLEAVHDAGEFPVLTFVEFCGGQRRLEIIRLHGLERANNPSQYIAISHVRHLGLGNLTSTSLPYCQLASLQLLANELSGTTRAPFWIDTMCLPLERNRRNSSLKVISSVYKLAAKVVVLDPTLYHHAVSSAEECIFRIRYSAWKERLWTLQEGVLAQDLHFKFKNKIVALAEILQQHESTTAQLLPRVLASHKTDVSWLHFALEGLVSDLKGTYWVSQPIPSKRKMARILRFGYLAFPIYRYFCEEKENRCLNVVVNALHDIYIAGHARTIRRPLKENAARERLMRLEASIVAIDGDLFND